MLVKRIETYFERPVDEEELLKMRQVDLANYLLPIMHGRFKGRGNWENIPTYRILMSLIRKRPRDLVKLCTLPAINAYQRNSNRIETIDFDSIFNRYSQDRIQDTINEYRFELPEIERLLMGMKPNKKERTTKEGFVYRTDQLINKINNTIENGEFHFSNGKPATN